MPPTANLLASTLGRISPRYRTLAQWSEIYRDVINTREISEKTKANRRSALSHVLNALGGRTISSIRPHEVAVLIQTMRQSRPQAAKRVLLEAKDVFNEAVAYGWIDRSPAAQIKAPIARVQRRRLTLEQWCAIAAHAEKNMPPWVARMLMLALVTGQRRSDLRKMRFSDVWDGYLHIEQEKTGARLALPLALRLNVLGLTIGDVIADCRGYAANDDYLLRKHNGTPLVLASLSARFETAREAAANDGKSGTPPSLHECRSLSERLYRAQGIDTMTLLGHKHQSMTDMYNDDRGLSRGTWKVLAI